MIFNDLKLQKVNTEKPNMFYTRLKELLKAQQEILFWEEGTTPQLSYKLGEQVKPLIDPLPLVTEFIPNDEIDKSLISFKYEGVETPPTTLKELQNSLKWNFLFRKAETPIKIDTNDKMLKLALGYIMIASSQVGLETEFMKYIGIYNDEIRLPNEVIKVINGEVVKVPSKYKLQYKPNEIGIENLETEINNEDFTEEENSILDELLNDFKFRGWQTWGAIISNYFDIEEMPKIPLATVAPSKSGKSQSYQILSKLIFGCTYVNGKSVSPKGLNMMLGSSNLQLLLIDDYIKKSNFDISEQIQNLIDKGTVKQRNVTQSATIMPIIRPFAVTSEYSIGIDSNDTRTITQNMEDSRNQMSDETWHKIWTMKDDTVFTKLKTKIIKVTLPMPKEMKVELYNLAQEKINDKMFMLKQMGAGLTIDKREIRNMAVALTGIMILEMATGKNLVDTIEIATELVDKKTTFYEKILKIISMEFLRNQTLLRNCPEAIQFKPNKEIKIKIDFLYRLYCKYYNEKLLILEHETLENFLKKLKTEAKDNNDFHYKNELMIDKIKSKGLKINLVGNTTWEKFYNLTQGD